MKRFKVTYELALTIEITEHGIFRNKIYTATSEGSSIFETVAKDKDSINFTRLENEIKIYYNGGAENDEGKYHTRVTNYRYKLDTVEEMYDYADCTAKQCFEELKLADFMEMVKNESKM